MFVCVCVCVWVYMCPAGLGQSSVSYSHFSVTQQSRVCLMFQLLFQRRYAETLSTVRLHEDPAWTSTSWTIAHTHTRAHTHTHTHTHVLTQSLTFCGHALSATVDLCEQPLPKNLLFPYGSHTPADCQEQQADYMCVCVCLCVHDYVCVFVF